MEMSNIERVITIEEFRKQNRKDSMWIIIDKKVIDITSYQNSHPGGQSILQKVAGKDATQYFLDQGHSNFAKNLKDSLQIGVIEGEIPEDIKEINSESETEEKKKDVIISYQELAKHKTKEDIWIEIDGIVYDVSKFMDEHPGGPAIILQRGGKIASQGFRIVGHSDTALKLMKDMVVGQIDPKDQPLKEQLETKDEKINPKQVMMILVVAFLSFMFVKFFAN